MRIATYRHSEGTWSAPLDTGLDSPATLVLAFGGRRQEEPIRELVAAHPRAVVLGCSTAGQIRDAGIDDGGLTAAVVRFDHTGLRRAAAPLPDEAASFDAGRAIAAELTAHPDLRAVFLLSVGLRVNGSELVRGCNDALPQGVVVTGGLAADGPGSPSGVVGVPPASDGGTTRERSEWGTSGGGRSRGAFEGRSPSGAVGRSPSDVVGRSPSGVEGRGTWVLQDGRPQDGWVTGVGFYGDAVRVGSGSRGGWDIFGPQRLVTRSEGNVLYELDGRPALDLYRQYLGEMADDLPAAGLRFPLALREQPDAEKQLVRTILSVDADARSMTFAGDIPQGALAQLMRANFDRLVAGAELAAQLTGAAEVAGPCLAIAISCAGRRMVLGEGSEEEVEATLDFLPPGTRQIGFYGSGELAPYSSGPSDLHNQTMTVTTVQEIARP